MGRAQLLSEDALQRLASLVTAVEAAEAADMPWRDQVSIHFLRNFTIEPVEQYLKYYLLREDLQPLISFGGYDTMSQELLDPGSSVNQNCPDVIVISLLVDFLDAGSAAEGWQADDVSGRFNELIDLALDRTSSLIVVNTFLEPVDLQLDDVATHDQGPQIQKLNKQVREIAAANPLRVRIADWQRHVSDIGIEAAIDKRFWKLSQAPFTSTVLNRIAVDVAKQVRALKGLAKKCLVLDCDNTLWGGVVGEDGVGGIALHPDKFPGSAFYAFQKAALELHAQGVLLALCSKNNEEDVWEVLEAHPHCLLQRSHIVASRINWINKAENIVSIATELNIGIDSLVFVDDNPRECALVGELLPEVTVLQVPENFADYADLLTRDGLFESLAQSDEDRKRTQMYQEAAQRQQDEGRFDDLSDYLKSLHTIADIARTPDADLARVAQLTQRTNQFNLTTRRYSEADIREFLANDNSAVYSMRVRDRYGDMGLTGVIIATREGTEGVIDTLLLSCRVLGRQLEFAFVDQCMQSLEKLWHLEAWKAEYIPTQKNQQVSDFWEKIGLELADDSAEHRRYSATMPDRKTDYMNIMTVRME